MTAVVTLTNIDAIISDATKAAEQAKTANYIHWQMKEDGSCVIVTTNIKGRDLAWIEYYPDQLDELIRQLQLARDSFR